MVQKHIAYLRDGIKLWFHPLVQTDEGEVLSFLCSIKIDVLKFFQVENASAQHIRFLLRLLKHLLAYGGYTLDDMVVSRIDYCYNIRIEDDRTRELLFRLLQNAPLRRYIPHAGSTTLPLYIAAVRAGLSMSTTKQQSAQPNTSLLVVAAICRRPTSRIWFAWSCKSRQIT